MRRSLLAVATAAVLGVGALSAAPAATAATCYSNPPYGNPQVGCADPTGVSFAASPATVTIRQASGTNAVALTAVFDDPADIMNGAEFQVALPDGTQRTLYVSGYLSKSGVRETYRATYSAYNFYAPGTYKVTAVARRDGSRASAFTGTPQVAGTFVVKHKVSSTISLSKYFFRKGEKLRFSGTVRGTTDAKGLKVRLQFKANGKKKKFKKTSKVVRTNAAGAWRSKKVKMNKAGRWRVKVIGKGHVVGAKSPVIRTKFRRR